MREARYFAVIVFLGYVAREAWTVLPERMNVTVKPFLLSEQEIQFPTYIWAGTIYLFFMMFSFVAFQLSTKLKLFFETVFIIQSLEFVEYFLNYNEHWGYWHVAGILIPINITMLRFPALLIVVVITFIKWKT